MDRNYPNPGVSAVLSFLFTGLGQIYNGQITKGLMLMTISAVSMLVLIIGAAIAAYSLYGKIGSWPSNIIAGLVLICLSVLVIAVTGAYNIYDAYNTAKRR